MISSKELPHRDVKSQRRSVSWHLRPPVGDECKIARPRNAMCREARGRYIDRDRFERRNGQWRVARRTVVLEASSTAMALGGACVGPLTWGRRDGSDRLYEAHSEIFGTP